MGSTGKPKRDNMDGTQMHGKHGDKVRRGRTHWNPWDQFKGCIVERVLEDIKFKVTGTHEATNALDDDNCRKVTLPTVVIVESKVKNKPGSRKNKAAPTVYAGKYREQPRCATECILTKAQKEAIAAKKRDEHAAASPGFDEDGCRRIRISDPIPGKKNIHTVDPSKFGSHSGQDVGRSSDLGKGARRHGLRNGVGIDICDNRHFELVSITLDKVGRSKLYMATCVVRNPVAKMKKTIMIKRVRNEMEAKVMLIRQGIDH